MDRHLQGHKIWRIQLAPAGGISAGTKFFTGGMDFK